MDCGGILRVIVRDNYGLLPFQVTLHNRHPQIPNYLTPAA